MKCTTNLKCLHQNAIHAREIHGHYTNSVETDIRKTFARVRRERANAAVVVNIASQVRCLTTKARAASLPRRALESTAR